MIEKFDAAVSWAVRIARVVLIAAPAYRRIRSELEGHTTGDVFH